MIISEIFEFVYTQSACRIPLLTNIPAEGTIIKLLCRLYDPSEGEILLNGIDIRKYDYHDYMDIFSVVFQDFKLFPYTIGQYVAAAERYDAERVRDCLVKAGFGERLAEMEAGLETCLYKSIYL